jgi:hypothetical protein
MPDTGSAHNDYYNNEYVAGFVTGPASASHVPPLSATAAYVHN